MVNPTITFETLLVPNSQLTKWITHPGLQHKLAKADNWEFLRHVHPRIKMVQDYKGETSNDDTAIQCKQLLLLPSSTKLATANHTATGLLASEGASEETQEGDTQWLTELLSEEAEETGASIRLGPTRPMTIAPNQLSFQYILKTLLPESALPPPSAYEQIGHVAHFNLKERHLPFKRLIGSALLESTTSGADSIQTVVNKVGQVDGKFRTYECEILADVHPKSNVNGVDTADNTSSSAASSSLETTVVEDGIAIELNVAECYWCTRLSGERRELIKDILKGRRKPKKPKTGGNLAPPLVVADVFCGAGAICMLLGKKIKEQDKLWKQEQQPHHQQQQQQQHPSLTVLANDWNPRAIEYMKRSIATNGMGKEKDQCMYHRFELSCRDSYDFLSELGEEQQTTRANPYVKKKLARKSIGQAKPKDPEPEQLPQQPLMPDHILMNFPLEAPQFLGALRWWSWKRIEDEGIRRQNRFGGSNNGGDWCPRFHVYTFARSSSPRADDEAEMAVNLVANELLPQPFFDDDDDLPDTKATEASSSSLSTPAYRRDELNGEFGTDFATRIVRDVAPGKVVVLVSFSVTPKLIRYMQGDFS
jgi:tRNA (guanine37-N1)-methyltransferase